MADESGIRKRLAPWDSELPPSSKRRLQKSSEETAASSMFSRPSSREPSEESLPEISKQAQMAQQASAAEGYYEGFAGDPQLLARSTSDERIPPRYLDGFGNLCCYPKHVSLVGKHPLKEKLEAGLRATIRQTLGTMHPCKWVATYYARIGYNFAHQETNPVVILVVVEKGKVSSQEAQRIVDLVYRECNAVGLTDIEIEMMEVETQSRGIASGERDDKRKPIPRDPEPFIAPRDYPEVGSSVGVSFRHPREVHPGSGTLGGYVKVDGEVFGITNHHVIFDKSLKQYTSQAPGTSDIFVVQPSLPDIERVIAEKQQRRDNLGPSSRHDQTRAQCNADITEFKNWKEGESAPDKSVFGWVWATSGIEPMQGKSRERRHRMDWALIRPDNADRFQGGNELFLNELPDLGQLDNAAYPNYIRTAMNEMGREENTAKIFPEFLKKHLDFNQVQTLMQKAEDDGKKLVVWKHGRTTHITAGIASDIRCDYRNDSGIISDEWTIMDLEKHHKCQFSDNEDSGSLVWDTRGFVLGLLWGGPLGSKFTFVTPIDSVFEDIKRKCGVTDVEIVVRQEDAALDVTPPKKERGEGFTAELT